jgi:MFS family permease
VAVALGHLVGGALVRMDPRAPFLVGALLLGAVLPWTLGRSRLVAGAADVNELSMASPVGRREPLWLAVAAAFVARFTVGCLVVSFALFVHKAHAIDDGRIGMLFAAMTIPFAAATYPAGVIVSRGLRASLLVASCAVYGALLATLSRLPGNALALAMMGMGVASAFLFASLLSLATSGRTGPARTRAISLVNGAGCLGMLVGPACSGIACAVLRAPDAPLRGYLASFAIAAGAVAAFLLVASPWLLPRAVRELADRPRVG